MKLNELNTIRHVLLSPVFELDEFPATADHDAGVVARYRDAPGIVDGACRFDAVARHRINPGSAELSQQVSLKYDAYTDEKNPWFVSYDGETWEAISKADLYEAYRGYVSFLVNIEFRNE